MPGAAHNDNRAAAEYAKSPDLKSAARLPAPYGCTVDRLRSASFSKLFSRVSADPGYGSKQFTQSYATAIRRAGFAFLIDKLAWRASPDERGTPAAVSLPAGCRGAPGRCNRQEEDGGVLAPSLAGACWHATDIVDKAPCQRSSGRDFNLINFTASDVQSRQRCHRATSLIILTPPNTAMFR